jgi:pantoate--beta-alanine ligase
VGLVPTMGALHAGHLSLVDVARNAGADRIIVSVFVNPTQFGANEDLEAYPIDLGADSEMLQSKEIDLLFTPSTSTMYPPGAETSVAVANLSTGLCGTSRPVHFGGVATVVCSLLNIAEPALAVFGEKDYQQLQVIRRMAQDLHIPTKIVGGPIVREPDGLAMSSRNRYLNETERVSARCLSEALRLAKQLVGDGETQSEIIIDAMTRHCLQTGGLLDYIALVCPDTLTPVHTVLRPVRALLAIRVGQARLIDNCQLTPPT